ncbi:hypothetical protein ACGTN9_11560 [Halobacillus sp. MO56]
MITVAEVLRAVSETVLVMMAILYGQHLSKAKKQRKLSTFEYSMYLIIMIAIVLLAVSLLLFTFAN